MYQTKITYQPSREWYRNQPIEWRNRMFELFEMQEMIRQEQDQRAAKLEIIVLQTARYLREHGITK